MTRILALTAAAFIAAASIAPAMADEHAADAAAPAAAEAVAPKEVTLKDGTKVSIEGDAAFVVAADGTKTPAPDGEWELVDGSKITTAAGKVVPGQPAGQNVEVKDAPAEGAAH